MEPFQTMGDNPNRSESVPVDGLHTHLPSVDASLLETLLTSEERLRTLIHSIPDAVVFKDANGRWLEANEIAKETFAFVGQDFTSLDVQTMSILSPIYRLSMSHCRESDEEAWSCGRPIRLVQCVQTSNEGVKYFDVIKAPVYHPDGSRRGIVVIARDMTEQRKSQELIHRLAYYDTLTGLPNQAYLYHHLNQILPVSYESPVALLFIDLDDFKQVNDTFGHAEGDNILKLAAERLRSVCGSGNLVVRFAGDEFVVVLQDTLQSVAPDDLGKTILNTMQKPFAVCGQRYYISVSMGISICPEDGLDGDTLLRNADVALQTAKEQGKNTVLRYHRSFHDTTARNLQIGNALRTAIENNEMMVVYQPKFHPVREEVAGVEALLRWTSASLGCIEPQEFVPIAEDNGLIVQIGEYVLATACRQAKQWLDEGIGRIPMAVNISVRQIEHPEFLDMVQRILFETQLPADLVELEITESLLLKAELSIDILSKLQELGIRVSFDDFGTGYSSLKYLQSVPIHGVKMDKSFVDQLNTDRGAAIVTAIMALAHSLGIKVIAEGVETVDQVEMLKRLGCDEVQGFLYSRPLPPDKVVSLLYRSR